MRVCIVPHLSGVGGMVSFQSRLTSGLENRGIEVVHRLQDQPYAAVLVIGGTRQLAALGRARRAGIPVIQRLDGMNWVHRVRRTGVRHYLRAEYGNLLLRFIRDRLADRVIYQSQFVQAWWQRVHGTGRVPTTVIYNGVDLQTYSDTGPHTRPVDRIRLLLVEGSLLGGYDIGLAFAVGLAQRVADISQRPVELMVVGKISPSLRDRWQAITDVEVRWTGQVAGERIPEIDRSAHLLFSADLNAACPNSVVEALACGLPVVSFDTGALPEMVTPESGRVIPYSGDPWQLDQPDLNGLAQGALEVLASQEAFRAGARARAESVFALDKMVTDYLQFLL